MTENREPNAASANKYKWQLRGAMAAVLIIEVIVILIAVYKLRR